MAKLNAHFEQETRERVNAFNSKEILTAFKAVGPCEEIPEDVRNLIKETKLPRVGKARLATFTYITSLENATYYGEKVNNACFAAIVKNDNEAMPTMFVYSPEWAPRVACRNVLMTVQTRLKKSFNLSVPEQVETTIRSMQGVEMAPKNILFEGSKARFERLASHPNNIVYGECIVEHPIKGENAWTIFVPDFEFRKVFANRIANVTNIDFELAETISNNWEHDTYVSIVPDVSHDAQKYANFLATISGLNEGDVVNDLLQGEISVISYLGKLYLDIDDEKPSAIIIKGKLNIYLPAALPENS